MQCTSHVSAAKAKLPQGNEPAILPLYLDDTVIFPQTAEEHFHYLQVVLDQFREHNLKLKPSKCNLFREEITYLAH